MVHLYLKFNNTWEHEDLHLSHFCNLGMMVGKMNFTMLEKQAILELIEAHSDIIES